MYEDKRESYYSNTRLEILPLLEPTVYDHILEVGCGAGNTLFYLKSKGIAKWVSGIELVHEPAQRAREVLDEVYEGNIESMMLPIESESVDVILCLDVLEHLVDPWVVVAKLTDFLKPGGILIASLPNARYWKVSVPLLFGGKFTYEDEGVLDRTHLRFFSRNSALEMLGCSGLVISRVEAAIPRKSKSWWLDVITLGSFTGLLAPQFLFKAVK